MRIKKKIIRELICQAIKDANQIYENWSGGAWLHEYGVESLLAYQIAHSIYENTRDVAPLPYITLEEPFKTFITCCQAAQKPGPLPKILKGNRRADIVIWQNYMQPWGVVEVKRCWTDDLCCHDLERLQAIMERYGPENGGTISFCCLAVFVHKKGKDLESPYSKIKSCVGNFCKTAKYKIKEVEPHNTSNLDNSDWVAGGIVVDFF